MLLTYLVLLKANLSRAFSNCFRGDKRLTVESACMSSLVLRSSVVCVLCRQEKQSVLPPPLLLVLFWCDCRWHCLPASVGYT